MKTCLRTAMAVAAAAILVSATSARAQYRDRSELPNPIHLTSQPQPDSEILPTPEAVPATELPPPAELEEYPPAWTVTDWLYDSTHGADDVVPRWTARVAGTTMKRANPSHRILFQDPLDPARHFDRGQFDFDFEYGVDASIARRLNHRHDLQFRYSRIFDGWDSAATGSTFSAPGLVVHSSPPLLLAPGRDVRATYESELGSFELNLRRRFNHYLTLLMGFRYTEVDERFHAELFGPGPVLGTYDTATENRLYGLQFGGEAVLWDRGGRLRIDNIVKAGIYGNGSGEQNTVLDTGTGGVFTASDQGGHVAFVGEVGLYAVFRLNDHLSIRGGYQAMVIEGLALAPDQVAVTDFVVGNGIDAGGNVFYHGALLGIELTR